MYYKLLNKTILTGALISLVYFNAHKTYAQEIIFEGDDVDISLPSDKVPPKDDIIPIDNSGIIVPEQVKKPKTDDFSLDDTSLPSPFEQDKATAPKEQSKPKLQSAEPAAKAKPGVEQKANPTAAPAKPKPATETKPATGAKQTAPVKANAPKPQPNNPVKAHSNQVQAKNAPANVKPNDSKTNPELKFGDSVLAQTNNELFNQMSDIEKQTTLLTLELKREKIRNEVEAAKAVRERAEQEKLAAEEAKKRKELEWQKEQEAKVIREQIALKQKEIEFEKLKQRKALTAYMNSMLAQKQAWIEENGKLYKKIDDLQETNKTIRQAYMGDMDNISKKSDQLLKEVQTAKNNHDRIVSSLTAQNAQLRKRIEANEEAARRGNKNASEDGSDLSSSADALIKPINIAKEYAIMEITGQGDELFVKLINKTGDSFMAKKGTVLQTGHMIEEITPNYVQFDRNGLKDFLYISTSTLAAEPNSENTITAGDSEAAPNTVQAAQARPASANSVKPKGKSSTPKMVSEPTVPSLGSSMFVK